MGVAALVGLYVAAALWLPGANLHPWEARGWLLGASLVYLLLLTLVIPGPAAALLSGEREQRTLQPLLLTALRPWQVTAGKYLVGLQPAAGLYLAALPLLLMGAHAGRLTAGRTLLLFVVLGAALFPVPAFALWLSGRCRRTLTATGIAYVVTAVVFWGTLAWAPTLYVRGENLWWYASPAWHAALLILAEPVGGPLARPVLPEWAWFLLFCAGVTALCLWRTTCRLAAAERAG
jgi:hypothetical protein